MDALFHAFDVLVGYVGRIGWGALALALVFHVLKVAARTRSWRNILAASYPDAPVRWRSVFGAYAAGAGVNAIVPARGGDVLKLFLVKRRIEGATYPTLASTLVVETLFDFVVASLLVAWALSTGVLPGLDAIPALPEIDWLWVFQHPTAAAIAAPVLFLAGLALGIWAGRRFAELKARLAQGLAIFSPPGRYFRRVVPWQALDWAFRLTTVYFLLRAFGVPADLHNALLVQVTQSLSTIVPLTPAGIGTEQALLVWVFRGEASASAVLSFSVGMKLTLIAANVALGFSAIALMLRTVRWRRAVAADPAAQA